MVEPKSVVKLSMRDRIVLYGLIRQMGSEVTYPLVREFRNDIAPTDEEVQTMGIVSGPGMFTDFATDEKTFVQPGFTRWNDFDKEGNPIDGSKAVEITATILGIIKQELGKLSSEKKLDDYTFPLWELFCKEGGE
jgi:hypothetical protein